MNQEAIDSLRAERDSALGLLDMAMDERDHFLKQRDKYQVAADNLAAENKVLHEAAQKALDWIEWFCGEPSLHPKIRAADLLSALTAALTKESTNG